MLTLHYLLTKVDLLIYLWKVLQIWLLASVTEKKTRNRSNPPRSTPSPFPSPEKNPGLNSLFLKSFLTFFQTKFIENKSIYVFKNHTGFSNITYEAKCRLICRGLYICRKGLVCNPLITPMVLSYCTSIIFKLLSRRGNRDYSPPSAQYLLLWSAIHHTSIVWQIIRMALIYSHLLFWNRLKSLWASVKIRNTECISVCLKCK